MRCMESAGRGERPGMAGDADKIPEEIGRHSKTEGEGINQVSFPDYYDFFLPGVR